MNFEILYYCRWNGSTTSGSGFVHIFVRSYMYVNFIYNHSSITWYWNKASWWRSLSKMDFDQKLGSDFIWSHWFNFWNCFKCTCSNSQTCLDYHNFSFVYNLFYVYFEEKYCIYCSIKSDICPERTKNFVCFNIKCNYLCWQE